MATTTTYPQLTHPPPPLTRPPYTPTPFITSLRALAQSHLSEIAAELTAEHDHHLACNLQLQLYAKPAHLPKPPQHQLRHQNIKSTSHSSRNPSDEPQGTVSAASHEIETSTPRSEAQKLPPLRPASDVLNRLRHDPVHHAHLSEYIIGYLERFEGMCEIPVSDWVRESTHEEFIPQHRIRYVIRRRQGDDELVWGRDKRIDRVFGSGSGSGSGQL